jgi:ankyrin repeat protein
MPERRYTPLACAILALRPELVRVLLKAGANSNGKGRYDMPILFDANELSSPEVVKVLLDAGADPRQKEAVFGVSPLKSAESRNDPQILGLIKAALEKSPAKK